MSTESQPKKFSKFGQAFVSYGSYHYDTVNKIIHIICIPLIAATLFSLLSYIPLNYTVDNLPVIGSYTVGFAEAFFVVAMVYYFSLSPLFGFIQGVLFVGFSFLWQNQFKDYESSSHLKAVFIIHVVAWIFQFIGHGVFQKRKPALLDNLTQILNAPLFVTIQLCELFGLKTEELIQWKQQIKKNVEQFRNKDSKNKSA